MREKYCFGWKFTIVYDKPQPNEQVSILCKALYRPYFERAAKRFASRQLQRKCFPPPRVPTTPRPWAAPGQRASTSMGLLSPPRSSNSSLRSPRWTSPPMRSVHPRAPPTSSPSSTGPIYQTHSFYLQASPKSNLCGQLAKS